MLLSIPFVRLLCVYTTTTMEDQPNRKKATRKKPAKKKATKKKATQKAAIVPQEAPVAESQPIVEGSELMANGLKFFSQLAQTLSDKEATAELVNSITEHDKSTGQTYLKVPVENQKTVGDAITMLGTLFKALQ